MADLSRRSDVDRVLDSGRKALLTGEVVSTRPKLTNRRNVACAARWSSSNVRAERLQKQREREQKERARARRKQQQRATGIRAQSSSSSAAKGAGGADASRTLLGTEREAHALAVAAEATAEAAVGTQVPRVIAAMETASEAAAVAREKIWRRDESEAAAAALQHEQEQLRKLQHEWSTASVAMVETEISLLNRERSKLQAATRKWEKATRNARGRAPTAEERAENLKVASLDSRLSIVVARLKTLERRHKLATHKEVAWAGTYWQRSLSSLPPSSDQAGTSLPTRGDRGGGAISRHSLLAEVVEQIVAKHPLFMASDEQDDWYLHA